MSWYLELAVPKQLGHLPATRLAAQSALPVKLSLSPHLEDKSLAQ
jgi:hypothetical protein